MPGKETMRNEERVFWIRKRLAVMSVVCLYSLCVLYGCTRKEELVLLTEEVSGQTQYQENSAEAVEPMQMSGAGKDDGQVMPQGSAAVEGQYLEDAGDAGVASASAYIEEETKRVYVHVCGAVITPGVYQLAAGSRVYDAVQAAGGFAECADESYVNQAQELSDGAKLVIPTKEEAGDSAQTGIVSFGVVTPEPVNSAEGSERLEAGSAAAEDGRININTATVEELCRIPGIGATRAAAIVAYREDHGGFKSPEDIMQVSGIKEGTYGKIKENISVK